ncbi:MAG: ribosome small subunit-dependent GTPase A [Candidatus Cloacimonetes bacterium]|nr:ribosome small subunit-dependent GTPase A [Candidatus Cloacimonadota bacterium]
MENEKMGWNKYWQDKAAEFKINNSIPGRVISQGKKNYLISVGGQDILAELSGKMLYQIRCQGKRQSAYPVTGDWVMLRQGEHGSLQIIEAVLPRTNYLARKMKISGGRKLVQFQGSEILTGGITDAQLLAVNIDLIIYFIGLDQRFSRNRIERFFTQVSSVGAELLIILNKIDKCPQYETVLDELNVIRPEVAVIAVSALKGIGTEQLQYYLKDGKTAVLMGASGSGKSTLVNRLLEVDQQETEQVREKDGKGRHKTSSRELFLLPGGGMLIDTPGLRELQLWADSEDIQETFSDIVELEHKCLFRNCNHGSEPGCAIKAALENGSLDLARYDNYLKMTREIDHLNLRKKQKAHQRAQSSREKNKLKQEIL